MAASPATRCATPRASRAASYTTEWGTTPRAAGILNAHGCRFRSRGKPSTGGLSDPSNLPAYSPDPNPIERAFSKLKAHLRRIGARSYDTLIRALGDICGIFDPEECRSFFKAAGYASN